ncbi:MAG: phosphatase PAP2 family protein [Flavobacteriales bacterium]|nr:phosphatase PAP2 family protein [Flavobacteriales bacterium]
MRSVLFSACAWAFVLWMVPAPSHAQRSADSSVYRSRPWVDLPLVLGSAGLVLGGAQVQAAQQPLGESVVISLDPASVNGFDRWATEIDLEERGSARMRSDVLLWSSACAPFALLFDREVRKEWDHVFTFYAEAMLATSALQSWTVIAAERVRPIAYIPEAPITDRMEAKNRLSFFSGHTSSTACASFFMARVLDDMHPEFGGWRWLLYTAALMPPAFTGYYRIQAGKHFPTDVLVGLAVGGATGVLVPALHKRRRPNGLSVLPTTVPGGLGLHMALQW